MVPKGIVGLLGCVAYAGTPTAVPPGSSSQFNRQERSRYSASKAKAVHVQRLRARSSGQNETSQGCLQARLAVEKKHGGDEEPHWCRGAQVRWQWREGSETRSICRPVLIVVDLQIAKDTVPEVNALLVQQTAAKLKILSM